MGESEDKESGLAKRLGNPLIRSSTKVDGSASGASTTTREPSAAQQRRSASTASKPAETNQQSKSKSFEFVLVTDTESRRQVRRHAMRQYMHQRRLDSIARLGAPRVPATGWTARPASDASILQAPGEQASDTPSDVPRQQEERSPSTDETIPPKNTKGKGPSRRVLPKPQPVKREDTNNALVRKPQPNYSGDPKAMPEKGAMRDPFDTYPMAITDVDHELVKHFVVTYPSMMYKFIDSAANNLNPMQEIFRRMALHDVVPFQAMLAIASKHRAGVEGKADSIESLTHKMRALRLMNERIQVDSEGRNDGTLYAIATMAVIEKWSKDASIERMHFRGLAAMIRNRGGIQGIHRSSPFLKKVLFWVDFSCAPKAIVGTALPWTSAFPDSPPTGFDFINPDLHLAIPHGLAASDNTEIYCDQFRACEDFLRFFRHLHALELVALNSHSTLASTDTHRRKSFVPGTKLHSIITYLPDYDHGIRDIRFIDEYTCIGCLLFLGVALYHSYSTSSPFDPYLLWLETEVDILNPYENPSITSILWLFLQHGGFVAGEQPPSDSGARCWVVSRMVRIAKHLEWARHGQIWDSLRQVLIDFLLTQQECALCEETVDAEALAARARKRYFHRSGEYFWDEDELRREILEVKVPVQMELGQDSSSLVEELNVPIMT
ncbi:hypothetical protein BJY01DRAFT_101126 [Aspergillus pseudoustus]|uniref:Fungal-specific transcription factor domain-containing protein n=1 Tax=Aspergillus pseudoustus TaxID=1810923 RepID=A0ABR4IZX3_9EURO